jgi:hypothetical protein
MAFLEVPGEERETGEESEEISEGDPFMGDLREETGNARSIREPGKQDLVKGDRSQPDERGPQSVAVENRNPEESESEENEIERDPEEGGQVWIGGDPGNEHENQVI